MANPSNNSNPIWHPFALHPQEKLPQVIKAYGIWLELANGKKIMDCISSWWVNIHGHCHPEIIEAITNQAKSLDQIVFADFSHESADNLAQGLLEILPSNMAKLYFTDDGSTSVELALKLAYQYWQNIGLTAKTKFIGFSDGYHGDTVGAMSLGQSSIFTRKFNQLMFNIEIIDYPKIYFNDSKITPKNDTVLAQIKTLFEQKANEIAGIVIEPLIQGAGGMNMCSVSFLQDLAKLCKTYNVLLIYDEVLTGFGRTGDYFAATKSQTRPDLICLSKGITGGILPLAATVMSQAIFDTFDTVELTKRFFHGHSYTANPIACAAAVKSLELLKRNHGQFNNMENIHIDLYKRYLAPNIYIKNYRVCGCIAAFDLNTKLNLETDYGNNLSQLLKENLLAAGLLFRPLGNVVYIMTPYCITANELELIYNTLTTKINALFTSYAKLNK